MQSATPLRLKDRFRLARFLHGEGPQAGPVILDRRRVFILPTRYGWLFALMLLALWLGAVNYNNGLAYALVFLLGALGMVSILHTWRNLAGLSISAGRVPPVFAGEQALFRLRFDNLGQHRLAIAVQVAAQTPVWTNIEQRAHLALMLPTSKRGYLPLGRFTIYTVFPLGLFRAWSPLDLDLHCLVYPRPAAPRPLPAASNGLGDAADGRGADDYTGLRSYQPGDSLRHVHWKSAARSDVLLVKQFNSGGTQTVWLDWHTLPQLDVETRLSILCRWVLEAHAAGLQYGLRLPEHELAPAGDDAHRHACLRALALYGT